MANETSNIALIVQNQKRFVFQTNLNKLLSDTRRFPPSSSPCQKCVQRKRTCICNTINSGVARTPRYEIKDLAETKSMLNELRDTLNDIDIEKWSMYTKLLDDTSLVTKHISDVRINVVGREEQGVELVTNAWVKMYEMIEQYKLVDLIKPNYKAEGGTVTSFHISECPGAFISALNHYIKSNNPSTELKWMATSFNPYHEGNNHNVVLSEDILFKETYSNWIIGCDGSGNVTKAANIEYIWDHISRPSRHNKNKNPILVDLVTADGSFNCQYDPNNQELLTASLKFSEVVCALGLLRVGGCFILKMYTLFEECSLSIMTLLSLCFKKIEVFKPTLSKVSNSEVYVICLNFNGITSILLSTLCKALDNYTISNGKYAIIPREWVPTSFYNEFLDCSKMFSQIQCRSLRHAMSQYKNVFEENPIYKQKREYATAFIKHFAIKGIMPDSRLVQYMAFTNQMITGKDTSSLGHIPKRQFSDYNSRCEYYKIYKALQQKRRELSKLDLSDQSLYFRLTQDASADELKDKVSNVIEFTSKHPITHDHYRNVYELHIDELMMDELVSDLKSQRYLRDNWFLVGRVRPHEFKMSHFVCNDLLFDVMSWRMNCSSDLPLVTVTDSLLVEGSVGEALSDIYSMPNAATIDLVLILNEHLDSSKYTNYLEISSNNTQQFPAISYFKRHGISGSLIYSFKSIEDTSLIHFDTPYELQVVLGGFLGDGTIEHCHEYNYNELLENGESYKSLINDLIESPLKHSCNFVFCDMVGSFQFHREIVYEEMTNKHVLVAQLIQALNCISDGGDLVIRLSTLYTRFTVGIIIVLGVIFEKVILSRPKSSSPLTQKNYIICKSYHDKDNSLCRHFLQCLWDALALHRKTHNDILQILKPSHFTHSARLLWDYNTSMLHEQLEEFLIHVTSAETAPSCRDFLHENGLADYLYPRVLVESGNHNLPILEVNTDHTCGTKRKREEIIVSRSPSVSSVDNENPSSLWSSDVEES